MCAGTRRRFFSSCESGIRGGMAVDVEVIAHHAETPLSAATNTAAANGAGCTFLTFVLGQRHFIPSYMAIRLPAFNKDEHQRHQSLT
jgi:hypothetical protein